MKSGDAMPIEPSEDLPIKPGQPAEPPPEDPPGNPNPEIPPPVREPGEPQRPDELPGETPDEIPVPGGPSGPTSPPPATSVAIWNHALNARWTAARRNGAAARNKSEFPFETRHNPA